MRKARTGKRPPKKKGTSHRCFHCRSRDIPPQKVLCYKCRSSLGDDFPINVNFFYAIALVVLILNLYISFPASMGFAEESLSLTRAGTVEKLQWVALFALAFMLVVTLFNLYRIRGMALHRSNRAHLGFYAISILFSFGIVYFLHNLSELSWGSVIGLAFLGLSTAGMVYLRAYVSRFKKSHLLLLFLGLLMFITVIVRAAEGMGPLGRNWFFQPPGMAVVGIGACMVSHLLLSFRLDLVSRTFGFYNLWTAGIAGTTVAVATGNLLPEDARYRKEFVMIAAGLSTLLIIIALVGYAIKKGLDRHLENNLLETRRQIENCYRFSNGDESYYALKAINNSIELNPIHAIDNPFRYNKLSWVRVIERKGPGKDGQIGRMSGTGGTAVNNSNTFEIRLNDWEPSGKKVERTRSDYFKGAEMAWIKKAELAIIKRDVSGAIGYYKKGIKANPDFSETWIELGNMFANRMGFEGDARRCYSQALKLKARPIKRWIRDRLPLRYVSWLIINYLFYDISLHKKGLILGHLSREGMTEAERLYGARAFTSGDAAGRPAAGRVVTGYTIKPAAAGSADSQFMVKREDRADGADLVDGVDHGRYVGAKFETPAGYTILQHMPPVVEHDSDMMYRALRAMSPAEWMEKSGKGQAGWGQNGQAARTTGAAGTAPPGARTLGPAPTPQALPVDRRPILPAVTESVRASAGEQAPVREVAQGRKLASVGEVAPARKLASVGETPQGGVQVRIGESAPIARTLKGVPPSRVSADERKVDGRIMEGIPREKVAGSPVEKTAAKARPFSIDRVEMPSGTEASPGKERSVPEKKLLVEDTRAGETGMRKAAGPGDGHGDGGGLSFEESIAQGLAEVLSEAPAVLDGKEEVADEAALESELLGLRSLLDNVIKERPRALPVHEEYDLDGVDELDELDVEGGPDREDEPEKRGKKGADDKDTRKPKGKKPVETKEYPW